MQQSFADVCIIELCTCSSLHICICRGSGTHIHTSGQNRGTHTHTHTRAHTHTQTLQRTIISDSQTVPTPGITPHSHTYKHTHTLAHKPSNPKPRHPVTFLRHPQTNTARPNHTRALQFHKIQISLFSFERYWWRFAFLLQARAFMCSFSTPSLSPADFYSGEVMRAWITPGMHSECNYRKLTTS